ncbi:hypothetical protein E1A91_D11G024300v1 [Gossypium mustelinum]|uniref:Uncharacterized protein n=1 Tax=Gossypium mustelinum TaxID=34275 RepID=A0A5D2SM27_GOSMU|nr:hypothetical protein E1A91_D11G024300v1 [Gossypium mustelinum]
MMSLTALLLRIIPPLIKGYPSSNPRRSKPWLKSKFEEQKLKPMIMLLNCYDVWLLRCPDERVCFGFKSIRIYSIFFIKVFLEDRILVPIQLVPLRERDSTI